MLDILSYLCILDLKECFHCVALANIVVIVCESILTLRDMVAYAILGKKTIAYVIMINNVSFNMHYIKEYGKP